jgi:hypothetical protein
VVFLVIIEAVGAHYDSTFFHEMATSATHAEASPKTSAGPGQRTLQRLGLVMPSPGIVSCVVSMGGWPA